MNHCGVDTRVIDSREYGEGVRRRRVCKVCGYRFSTFEQIYKYRRSGDAYEIPPLSELLPYETKELAEKYNVSHQTVRNWLKHHGV